MKTTEEKTTMLSFHGKPEIKEQYLTRLRAHYAADEIVKGQYWEKGKGCAVGCTVHSNLHSAYETELGTPRIIARLEDKIFENIPNDQAKEFPIQFLQAVPVGKDLENVWRKFMIWLLVDETEGVIKYAKTDGAKKAIQDVADAFTESLTKKVPYEKWNELRNAVNKQRVGVAAAAAAAAAAADAADAADAAADDAAYAADAAAAYAAAYAADAAADAAAADAARTNKYIKMKEKLLELLSAV